jgi:tetratricopeptide (TPR) repeat protein
MNRSAANLLAVCAIILFCGCANLALNQGRNLSLSGKYRAKALEYEKSGDWQMALFSYEIAEKLHPEDKEISKKKAALEEKTRSKAERHFKKGLSDYKRNSLKSARNQFLTALRYDPDHQEAYSYLTTRLGGINHISYSVQNGDTLKSIADKIYKDPEKDFLIAYFNDLDITAQPASGTMLQLPLLEEEHRIITKPEMDIESEIAEAKALLEEQQYEQALTIVEKVLEYAPDSQKATDIRNACYYNMGNMMLRKKQYLKSLEMFNNTDPDYKNVSESISNVKKQLGKKAEDHFRKGVQYFINEKLEQSIKEWKKTLALNPDHEEAKKNIIKAESLLEKLENF